MIRIAAEDDAVLKEAQWLLQQESVCHLCAGVLLINEMSLRKESTTNKKFFQNPSERSHGPVADSAPLSIN